MSAELGKSACAQIDPLGHRGGRHRRELRVQSLRLRQHHEPRHRGHQRRHRLHPRRHAPVRRRRDDRRVPHLHSHRRGDFHWRGGRLHCLGGRSRRAQGRTGERGLEPGPRLLRPRRGSARPSPTPSRCSGTSDSSSWTTAPSPSTRTRPAPRWVPSPGASGAAPRRPPRAIVDIAVSGMYVEVSKLISRDGIDHRGVRDAGIRGGGADARVLPPGEGARDDARRDSAHPGGC